jgi:peptide/nickel transport system substrate-binding protein
MLEQLKERNQEEEKREEADSSQRDNILQNSLSKMSKRFSFWHFFLLLFLCLDLGASTLNLSITSNPSRINPVLSTDSASSEISGWIFNGLFKYDKDGNVINDLADSYKFITPTHLKIKLEKNVTWHDGEKLTSKDVLFTYQKIMDKKVFTPLKTTFAKVKDVKLINDYEIDIFYHTPYFKALHLWMIGILPHHLLKDEKDLMTSKFNKNPIGTGSYKLDTFKPSSDIILKVNKEFFGKVPNIENIKYKFIPDPNTSYAMLNQKKLDMGSLTPLQLDRQLKDDFKNNFSIYESPSFSYTYMGFNLKREKFKDKKLREAINLAIDKKEILDILFFSHAKVCNGPFLPGTFAFNDNIKSATNIQKAKQLLKELGYDKNNQFSFTVITNANNSIRVNAAQIIQHQLKRVNIDMKIRVMEWQAFLNTIVMPKNFDAIILGWGLALMPDARSIWHSKSYKKGGFNFVGYSNKIVDSNIQKAEITTDYKVLSKLYKEIFKEIATDLPYIFLYIPNSITAVNKDIRNVTPSLIGVTHNQEEWIKP